MARRERRKPEPGEFEDPLSNFDGPAYEDEFERSLSEDQAVAIEHRPFLAVMADQTIRSTMAMMAEKNIACVVVVNDENQPVGIISERDVMTRVAGRFDQLADQPIAEVMTPEPVRVYAGDTPARVLNVMVTRGVRHVPVLDADNRLVGVIGARRLTAYLQKHFAEVAGK